MKQNHLGSFSIYKSVFWRDVPILYSIFAYFRILVVVPLTATTPNISCRCLIFLVNFRENRFLLLPQATIIRSVKLFYLSHSFPFLNTISLQPYHKYKHTYTQNNGWKKKSIIVTWAPGYNWAFKEFMEFSALLRDKGFDWRMVTLGWKCICFGSPIISLSPRLPQGEKQHSFFKNLTFFVLILLIPLHFFFLPPPPFTLPYLFFPQNQKQPPWQ